MLNEKTIDLGNFIEDLIADGRLSHSDANLVAGSTRNNEQLTMHPLNYIASLSLADQSTPNQLLTEEHLCRWLSEKSQLPIFTIDP